MRKPKVVEVAYHRNGVMGNGFHVVLFRDTEGETKVAIRFPDDGGGLNIAVLDVNLLAQENIRFGENSWRGDEYAPLIDQAIQQHEAEAAA